MGDTKRIKLTRSLILAGSHADAGSVHEVGRALANRLIGEGSAEHDLEEGEDPEVATSVTRMEQPGNRDPEPKQVKPAPPKVKKEK